MLNQHVFLELDLNFNEILIKNPIAFQHQTFVWLSLISRYDEIWLYYIGVTIKQCFDKSTKDQNNYSHYNANMLIIVRLIGVQKLILEYRK